VSVHTDDYKCGGHNRRFEGCAWFTHINGEGKRGVLQNLGFELHLHISDGPRSICCEL